MTHQQSKGVSMNDPVEILARRLAQAKGYANWETVRPEAADVMAALHLMPPRERMSVMFPFGNKPNIRALEELTSDLEAANARIAALEKTLALAESGG